MSDRELLQQYAREGSQTAFAALVAQHLNLVYSAARRQVSSAQLAEEVAQSVFLELSRQAAVIKPGTPLAAWLYVVTRRLALNARRGELRRLEREHAAYELAAMNSSASPAWPQVEPLLDEAMESLDEEDRGAVLLRYFENQSLREVGEALGTSDDTAQKRVSRAVDQLRAFFLKRGVAVSATGLATDLSAHAIQAAPFALGVSISATTTVASHTLLVGGTKTLVMTSLQKTSLAAVLALTVGAGLYEAGLVYRRQGDLQSQRAQVAELDAQVTSDQRQRTAVGRQTAAVRGQIASLQAALAETKIAVDPAMDAEMRAWYGRLDRINQAFAGNPQLKIPELQFLTEKDWFAAAQTTELETPEQLRKVLANLRTAAKNKLLEKIGNVLSAYLSAHNGAMPEDPAELQAYFNPPIDPAILARYEIAAGGSPQNPAKSGLTKVLREKEPVDLEYDNHIEFSSTFTMISTALTFAVREAQRAYATANQGQRATEPAQLLPYLKGTVEPSKLLPYLKP